jgi:signal transduction histidine kinase
MVMQLTAKSGMTPVMQGRRPSGGFVRALLAIAIILAELALSHMACAQDSPPAKHVLMLYGHDPNAPGVTAFSNELHAIVRANSPARVVFYDELLDLSRFPENARREQLLNYIVGKYRGVHLDAILTDGTRALKFAIERVRVHFPNVPIVYGLAFEPEVDFAALPENVTGRHHLLPFTETLKLAHAFQPDAERVVIIAGSSDTDSLLLAQAIRDLTPLVGGMQLEVWQDWTYSSLLQKMRTLPPRSIAILSSFTRDQSGQIFNSGDLIASITRWASAPVYGIVRNWVGDGIVGGATMDFGDDGKHTGQLLLKVLNRESAKAPLPPSEIAQPVQVVDARALERWGLSESKILPGTDVLFRTPTVWDRYRGYILAVLLLVIVQSGMIAALLIHRARRRRAEAELVRSQESLRTSYERVRDLGSRLLKAQEIERSRIARDLHDDIGQQVALLGMHLAQVRGASDLGEINRLTADAHSRNLEIARSLRDLSHSLHPARLRMFGLVGTLESLSLEVSHSGIAISFTHDNVPSAISADVSLCIFRVAQEALQNAIKHSRANEVTVHLAGGAGGLNLSIVDDGVGFEVEGRWSHGLGLLSMKERLEAIGGVLEIRSAPGRGTRLEAAVPADVIQSGGGETRPGASATPASAGVSL